ncbi:MAG: riboflavin synthase [Phycisphaerales bacterium]|nr:riboflavin synthase [Phycisphaerales bacterium]
MFAGIVEFAGRVVRTEPLRFADGALATRLVVETGDWLADSPLGSSIAVNGACLTLAGKDDRHAFFDVVAETVRLTNLGAVKPGDRVNLERSLRVGDRIDGHFVQGHVDGLGVVESNGLEGPEWIIRIAAPAALAPYLVRKGSISVDGVSLTLVDVDGPRFSITLIPTTLEKTVLGKRKPGDRVNLETDVIARLIVQRLDSMLGVDASRTLLAGGFALPTGSLNLEPRSLNPA